MPSPAFSSPIKDSVPRVDGDVAVGEDLEFQRKWWRFERGIWFFFVLVLICDLLGLFGRGYLAKARQSEKDHSLVLDYERIERASTPSIMTLHFSGSAIHDGKLRVFLSESIVRELGAQRISPQPAVSTLTDGGILYTFDATGPAVVEIALSPSFPGVHHFQMNTIGSQPIKATVVVVP